MKLKLHVWRQNGPDSRGHMAQYEADNLTTDMSLLEMLDQVNEELNCQGRGIRSYLTMIAGKASAAAVPW